MFLLDGKPLSLDVPFTATNVDGDLIQYPANWLRLASPEDRAAIGITEEPDPTPVDFRFYWDTGIPKDHAQLVTQWVAQTRITAGTLLAPSDWQIIREADNATPVPADVKAWREAIRLACNEKVIYLGTTNSTEELAAYVTSPEFSQWEPVVVVEEPPTVDFVTSGSAFTASTLFGGEGADSFSL